MTLPLNYSSRKERSPVAQYYDVPVINQRLPLVNHFARHPQLVGPYFAQEWVNLNAGLKSY